MMQKERMDQSVWRQSVNLLTMAVIIFHLFMLPEVAKSQGSFQADASSLFIPASDTTENYGYRNIAVYKNQFIAVGTSGRMDLISLSGVVTALAVKTDADLNSVICDNDKAIAVGDDGKILVSTNGQACVQLESGTNKNLHSIALFNSLMIAGADKGTVLVYETGNSWKELQLPVKGDIVSISAGASLCFAVTNKGEILRTSDGLRWEIFDYNMEYKGYNKPSIFAKILFAGGRIAVIGRHEDGSPVALFSSLGNVWTERSLNYMDDDGMMHAVTNLPNDICYDSAGDQFFLAFDQGEVVSLPSCSHCNKLFKVGEYNLNGIGCFENTLMIVGDNYFVKTLKFR